MTRKKQAVEEILEMEGLTPALQQALGSEPVELLDRLPTAHELRNELMRMLWRNRSDLKPGELVQGIRAIASLADSEIDRETSETQVSILDRIDSLPVADAMLLLEDELTVLETMHAEYLAALERMRQQ